MNIFKRKAESNRVIERMDRRISDVEEKLKIHLCGKHHWVDFAISDYSIMTPHCIMKCDKCGDIKYVTHNERNEIKLDQALDEVEALGGEVDRSE